MQRSWRGGRFNHEGPRSPALPICRLGGLKRLLTQSRKDAKGNRRKDMGCSTNLFLRQAWLKKENQMPSWRLTGG